VWRRNNDGYFLVYIVRFALEHGRYGVGGRSREGSIHLFGTIGGMWWVDNGTSAEFLGKNA
jgi:hypothetical protein